MKKPVCCYCGWKIRAGEKACAQHKDLLPLDLMQTGWKPK